MKHLKTFLLILSICAALGGCNSSDSSGNAPPNASKDGAASVAKADLAKCGGCGTDVPKAELVSHDGKMMCKACIDAHGH